MRMELSGQMKLEQRMKLAPRMIQSMEVLQLPLLALQEKIEAELASNPVLELDTSSAEEVISTSQDENSVSSDEELVVDNDGNNAEDFGRLDSLGEDFKEFVNQSRPIQINRSNDDTDAKYEAIQNTAASPISLHDYLMDQWHLYETSDAVRAAGEAIIDYIDNKGFLTVHIEQLYNKDRSPFTIEDLEEALKLVQTLEPAGVGARDLRECLLIQMNQSKEYLPFERRLISDYYDLLLENRLPEIAKRMNASIERVKEAIAHIAKLDTSPGLLIGSSGNRPVMTDVIIEPREDGPGFTVRLAGTNIPNLRVNDFYLQMAKNKDVGEKTRQFLQQNIRSAQWLMEAVEQRQNTLLKVATAIVNYQQEFFEKGELYLKPLSMQQIADEVGVHIATVSRAVAGKYAISPQGVIPLRSLFTGGSETKDGKEQSWNVVKTLLQEIIANEDKSKPLSDDALAKKLKEKGVKQIARRTVAKYRKLLNIPSARFRKKF